MNGPLAFSADDHCHMARALYLARKGIYSTDPNPNVGCVIVSPGGQVVGEGWHRRAGEPHAEIHALQQAGTRARGATAYVTLEPCSHHGRTPPCTDALLAGGIAKVVCTMQDPNPLVAGRGIEKLRAAGVTVAIGLMADEALELNRGFNKRMQTGRPWVCTKIAASMDGRTALQSGQSKWITGAPARADVQRLRAGSSAILTGIGTVLADNPRLDVRDTDFEIVQQPLRVIADSGLRLPVDAALLDVGGAVQVFHAVDNAARARQLAGRGAVCKRVAADNARVSLSALLDELGKSGCNRVLVEAGPELNGALLRAGLLDEIIVYQSARIMGSAARGMFMLPDIAEMSGTIATRLVDVRRLGEDLRLTYRMA